MVRARIQIAVGSGPFSLLRLDPTRRFLRPIWLTLRDVEDGDLCLRTWLPPYSDTVVLSERRQFKTIAQAFPARLTTAGHSGLWGDERPLRDRPLSSFKDKIEFAQTAVTEGEVRKAIDYLTLKRVTGPDGIPVEIYRNLPVLVPYSFRLPNLVFITGQIPRALRRVHLAPLSEPKKDSHSVDPLGAPLHS